MEGHIMRNTIEVTIIFAMLVPMSLLGLWIIFRFLKGTALIKPKDVQLGSAAAMLGAIFVLLNLNYPEIKRGLLEEVQAAQTEKGTTEIARVSLAAIEKQKVVKENWRQWDSKMDQDFAKAEKYVQRLKPSPKEKNIDPEKPLPGRFRQAPSAPLLYLCRGNVPAAEQMKQQDYQQGDTPE